MQEIVEVKFTGNKPSKKTKSAAAFDLYAAEDVLILPGESGMVGTGTFIELGEDCEGLLNIRSGLASSDVFLANGTGIIDADYRGEVKLIVYNGRIRTLLYAFILKEEGGIRDWITLDGGIDPSKVPGVLKIKKGDRIGQLRVRKIPEVMFIEVEELTETDRGSGGFGSTGV